MPPIVVIPSTPGRKVLVKKVESILCNRVQDGAEQYLVRWKTNTQTQYPPLSWHSLNELARCLEIVQDYLDARSLSVILHHDTYFSHPSSISAPTLSIRKRKSPDHNEEPERRLSPAQRHLKVESRTPSTERSPSITSTTLSNGHGKPAAPTVPSTTIEIYNGDFDYEDGYLVAKCLSAPGVARINVQSIPTEEMLQAARTAPTTFAERTIRETFFRRLRKLPGPAINLFNVWDASSPSLRFKFISEYVLQEGVFKADAATQEGCQKCSPQMGRYIGCEYTKKCGCLEYAAVDEARLDEDGRREYQRIKQEGGSTIGLPKKFPYFAEGSKKEREGCLVSFYRNSRNPIYECNDNCKCGDRCRNKNVQFGRRVELEIFKTEGGRGWGLRCKQDLHEGEFIDTYRGEVITDAEASRREENAGKSKASYLYSLDKFAEVENLAPEDIYVVDGEFMGGPTKFMNHSCEPNCRQYTVSYNKHDCRVYDIAFFASRFIPRNEELTFDYLDKDDEEEEGQDTEEPGEDAVPCLCGAAKCRKWLWT